MDVTAHVSITGSRLRTREAYVASGRRGPRALAMFLPPRSDYDYLPALNELVRTDLEYHWSAGAPLRLDAYRVYFPDLFRDPAVVAGLAELEARLRDEYRPHPFGRPVGLTDTPAPVAAPTPRPLGELTQ